MRCDERKSGVASRGARAAPPKFESPISATYSTCLAVRSPRLEPLREPLRGQRRPLQGPKLPLSTSTPFCTSPAACRPPPPPPSCASSTFHSSYQLAPPPKLTTRSPLTARGHRKLRRLAAGPSSSRLVRGLRRRSQRRLRRRGPSTFERRSAWSSRGCFARQWSRPSPQCRETRAASSPPTSQISPACACGPHSPMLQSVHHARTARSSSPRWTRQSRSLCTTKARSPRILAGIILGGRRPRARRAE